MYPNQQQVSASAPPMDQTNPSAGYAPPYPSSNSARYPGSTAPPTGASHSPYPPAGGGSTYPAHPPGAAPAYPAYPPAPGQPSATAYPRNNSSMPPYPPQPRNYNNYQPSNSAPYPPQSNVPSQRYGQNVYPPQNQPHPHGQAVPAHGQSYPQYNHNQQYHGGQSQYHHQGGYPQQPDQHDYHHKKKKGGLEQQIASGISKVLGGGSSGSHSSHHGHHSGHHSGQKDSGLFSSKNLEKAAQMGMTALAAKSAHKGYKSQMKYEMGMGMAKKFFK